jgi:hypothetical protein
MARIHDYPEKLQKEFRAMIADMSLWPNPTGLPMKRPRSGGLDVGTLLPRKDGEPFVIRIDFAREQKVTYSCPEDLFNDNWVVD